MGVLLMLMTVGGLIAAAILMVIAAVGRKVWLAKFTLSAVAVWFTFYFVMLFGFSLTSSEKTLSMNEAKEYCGFYLDCHVHTVVTGVRTAKQIGDRVAQGEFQIVNVRVFSDAKKPSIAFRLLEPKARIVLPGGEKIERDPEAEKLLPSAGVSLGADIRGRETIEKEIVFDGPPASTDARLLITEGYGIDKVIERFLVGDEDSIFHAKTFFKLQEQTVASGVK